MRQSGAMHRRSTSARRQLAVGLMLVAGHNLLDGVAVTAESPFFVPWAVLHQRDVIELGPA